MEEKKIQPINLNACVCATYWDTDFSKISEQKGVFSRDAFGPCFCDYEKENRELRVKYMKSVIDLAVELEVGDMSTISGYVPLRGTCKLALQNSVDSLKEVVDYSEKKGGVRINLEYEPGLLIGDAEIAMETISRIGSPLVGLNFDIGHTFVTEGDVVPVIKEVHHKIRNVHVEDIGLDEKKRPVHYHLIPGLGVMPLADILRTLKELDFKGWHIVELYTYDKEPVFAANESFKVMKKLEKEVESE